MSTEQVNEARSVFRHYRGSNGAYIEMPKSLDVAKVSWWARFKNRYFKWEHNLTVANKVIEKGWVIPQPLGIALCVLIFGGVGGLYWRIIDKQAEQDKVAAAERAKQSSEIQELNKLLIRLDQRLIDKDKADGVQQQKSDSRMDSIEAWQEVTNKDLARLLPRK